MHRITLVSDLFCKRVGASSSRATPDYGLVLRINLLRDVHELAAILAAHTVDCGEIDHLADKQARHPIKIPPVGIVDFGATSPTEVQG